MEVVDTIIKILGFAGAIAVYIFTFGQFQGRQKEQQKAFNDALDRCFKRQDNIEVWIREHEKMHKEQDSAIADKISNIDKNVSILITTCEFLKDLYNDKKNNKD